MIKRIFTFLILILFTNSCSVTEEVLISETGAIDYVEIIDIPQMGALLNKADLDEKIQINQISNAEYSYLDFMQLLEEMGSKKNKGKFEKYKLYKTELSKIDFFKFRLDMRDKFTVEIINRSKSVDEFNAQSKLVDNTFKEIKLREDERIEANKNTALTKRKKKKKNAVEEKNPFSDNPFSMSTGFDYSFDGKNFTKKIDVERYLNNFHSDDSSEEEEGEKLMLLGMMKKIKYKYKYTFPRKIKSLSLKDAMFTADGKSFIMEYSLSDIIDNPELANFEVELED
ncbi:hypothetical protein SAMN05443634_106231 [Chishuiella changwenlii]|nr:hypothetical protein [Chishuiella changwenlii]SHL17019.1 hypothetical protein SAMN05443634_106231 [Chishuiella changwenlii]